MILTVIKRKHLSYIQGTLSKDEKIKAMDKLCKSLSRRIYSTLWVRGIRYFVDF